MISLLPAYVDPTAGGMLLQIILAGIAGLLLGIQMFWRRILRLFGIRREDPPSPPPDAPAPPPDPAATESQPAPPKDPA